MPLKRTLGVTWTPFVLLSLVKSFKSSVTWGKPIAQIRINIPHCQYYAPLKIQLQPAQSTNTSKPPRHLLQHSPRQVWQVAYTYPSVFLSQSKNHNMQSALRTTPSSNPRTWRDRLVRRQGQIRVSWSRRDAMAGLDGGR